MNQQTKGQEQKHNEMFELLVNLPEETDYHAVAILFETNVPCACPDPWTSC